MVDKKSDPDASSPKPQPADEQYASWGNFPKVRQSVQKLSWRDEIPTFRDEGSVLPRGRGRSYGDSCLNADGTLVDTSQLNHIMHFDRETGLIRCESGLRLAELLDVVVPAGWFVPVVPGTKYVSIGGAIANDIHGKNHHAHGTFGCHVQAFELLRSDGSRTVCTPQDNAELFAATIGGLGLTGLVTWADIQLRRVNNDLIDNETIKFGHISEFAAIDDESSSDYEYTVAWIDSLAQGPELGRGHYMRGNHAAAGATAHKRPGRSHPLDVPMFGPNWLLNRWTIKAFNKLYFKKQRYDRERKIVHYNPFFFPLDGVGRWNRVYGKRGFFQYQCVVPTEHADAITEIVHTVSHSDEGSFLTVLKRFGDIASPGMLSFPKPGLTVTFDLANRGVPTLQLMQRLDEIVAAADGRVYPAKDARMAPESFRQYFPQWVDFQQHVDPKFSSSFWRRVTESADVPTKEKS